MWRLREFIRSVKNVWYWFPIIWKDRDWDHDYIFEVLKHKLKSQSKYIGERDGHTTAQQDARRMSICVSLIEKIQDDSYATEHLDYIDDELILDRLENNSEAYSVTIKTHSNILSHYFDKYPLIYKRVLKGEGRISLDGRDTAEIKKLIAMNMGQVNQERAHKLLFKIMEENILKWWD